MTKAAARGTVSYPTGGMHNAHAVLTGRIDMRAGPVDADHGLHAEGPQRLERRVTHRRTAAEDPLRHPVHVVDRGVPRR